MNDIKTNKKNSLKLENLEKRMIIKQNGPKDIQQVDIAQAYKDI